VTRTAKFSWGLILWALACASGCDVDSEGDAGTLDAPMSDTAGLDAPRDTIGLDVPGLDAPTSTPDGGMPSAGCAPLPAPSGTVVSVDVSMAGALPAMVRDAAPNTTFVLADGTYRMTGDEAARRIQIRAAGVTLRSASGNAAAVIIDGEYGTNEMITVHSNDVTIAEITVMHAVDHCVHVTPPDGTTSITGFLAYGVRIQDCGEQFIKINPNGARTAFTDDGEIACSHFELTDAGRPHIERAVGGCYTGGIDAHGSRGWLVRDNTFVDIYCETEGLAEHAIHFWTGSRDTVIERNLILNCARGIGLGLVESGATRDYPDDPYPGLFVGHYEGIVRNNVIVADVPFYDTGIELDQARGALVVHNTIIETAAATNSFSSIDTRFDNSLTTVRNNLTRRITVRSGISFANHNLENVPLGYFVDGATGDAHLTSSATDAIDQGAVIPECPTDADGMTRVGPPDLGAYERP
jgi:hypothetical protein